MNTRPSKSHPKFREDRIQFIKKYLDLAIKEPRKVAEMMKEQGLYSDTTYVGDIERTVNKVAAVLNTERPNWAEVRSLRQQAAQEAMKGSGRNSVFID